MATKLTVFDLQKALLHRCSLSQKFKVPNTQLLFSGEQDWVEITRANYAWEYEIKLTRADFKKDFDKTSLLRVEDGRYTSVKKHDVLSGRIKILRGVIPRRFYFVAPRGIIDVDKVPDYAGLIVAQPCSGEGYRTCRLQTIKEAPTLQHGTKLDDKHFQSLLRTFSFRFFRLWIKGNS